MSVTIERAGIDTWSPCWYVDPGSREGEALTELATIGAARGRLLPDAVDGHRVGWFPAAGLLYAEGHPDAEGLCAPRRLPERLVGLSDALLAAGLPVPEGLTQSVYDSSVPIMAGQAVADRRGGFAGIRRLDSTVDIRTESSAQGLAVMAGIAAVARDMPRTTSNVWWGAKGAVETVSLHGHGGGKLLGRIYDKGVEAGTAPPGRLLRPEDQRRWGKDQRRDVGELTAGYVRQKFHQRFAPLWQASKGVTVAGPIVIAEKLAAAVEAGELTRAAARNLAGDTLLALAESAHVRPSRRTQYRHRARLRDHGLVLADGVLQEVEVDVAAVLEQALDASVWGAGED